MSRAPLAPGNIVAGLRGPTGLPGVNAVPADEAVAAYLTDGEETPPALDAAVGASLADSDSATHAAVAAGFALDPKAPVAGGVMRLYGDSWGAGLGLVGGGLGELAAAALGMSIENVAISGSAGLVIGHLMLAPAFPTMHWDPGDADAVVFVCGLNDSRYNELTDPTKVQWVNGMRHSLRLALALALGNDRVVHSDASWSQAGLWTNAPYGWCTNGANVSATQLPGSSRSVSFEDDEITIVVGGLLGESKAIVDFYIDGEKVRSIRLHDDVAQYPGSDVLVGWRAERFTGLTPGTHTLMMVKADETTDRVFVDSYILPSDDPPQVVLVKESPPKTTAYTDPAYAPYNVGSPASTKVAHKIIEDVAADFSGARVAPYVVLDTATDFQGDDLHYDASGRAKLRDALVTALDPQALPARVDDLASGGGVARAVGVRRPTSVLQVTTPTALAPYYVPEGATALRIRVLGGGGGGGSGRRGAAGGSRCGGGGGGGAGYADVLIPTHGLPKILYVTCGAGGNGGAARVTNDLSGAAGAAGVPSYVVTNPALPADESIYLAYAPGGVQGSGGTGGAGAGGVAVASRQGLSGGGGSASTTGLAGSSTSANGYGGVGQGGGSGGGISAANVAAAGGAGWWSNHFLTAVIAQPAGGANTGGAGGSGAPTNRMQGRLDSEGAGGGGGANLTGAAGAGGAGGRGSGGGGGGASLNGNNSGAGGKGGDGFVEITAYF